MNIGLQHQADTLTVTMTGTIDYAACSQMEGLIGDLGAIRAPRVVFDLAGVTRVDSVGLGMLHIAKDTIIEAGSRLSLQGATGMVRRLFELTDVDHSFDHQ
jgi:anti-anti-sigma factor